MEARGLRRRKDSQASFENRSSALVFLNLVKKAEKYGVHFPFGHNFVFPRAGY